MTEDSGINEEDIENWLQDAGYKYYCFISWPRTKYKELNILIENLKCDIEGYLSLSFFDPKIFWDGEIEGGDVWEETISYALCRSVALVAICVPIYYRKEWCTREFFAMKELCKERFKKKALNSIIPLKVKEHNLPQHVSKIQAFDFTDIIVRGEGYYQTDNYRSNVRDISEKIIELAKILLEDKVNANCEDFQLPEKATFF